MPSTLSLFNAAPPSTPATTTLHIEDVSEFQGSQNLFTRNSSQALETLKDRSVAQSIACSNLMDGVNISDSDLGSLFRSHLRDGAKVEGHGYADALQMLHSEGRRTAFNEKTILHLHRLTLGETRNAGKYRNQDEDFILRGPNEQERVRFPTVPAKETRTQTRRLVSSWNTHMRNRLIHPLIAMALFNLDFMCICPFQEGTGRVSRLLLLLQCYQLGYDVGRFISLERVIYERPDRYYNSLAHSSSGWHEGRQDPWPYVDYILDILKKACYEFVKKASSHESLWGTKTLHVKAVLAGMPTEFTRSQLEQECPGVSKDMVRVVLRKEQGRTVDCCGHGPGALWRKRGNTLP